MDEPEKFRVNCPCGDHVLVSEGAAGLLLICSCGKAIQIPSSTQLRLIAGKPIAPPEEVIEGMLYSGVVPGRELCARCCCETSRVVHVQVECERAYSKNDGDSFWLIALLAILFLAPIFLLVRFLRRDSHDEKRLGRDKIYPLPLFVCDVCKPALADAAVLKQCLCRIPEYRHLFEKFPNAKINLIR